MEGRSKLTHKTAWVVVNLSALVLCVLLFSSAIIRRCPYSAGLGLVALIVLIVSARRLYFKTGVWTFVHRPAEAMDERELSLARMALQTAYVAFTLTALIYVALLSMAMSLKCALATIAAHSSILWIVLVGLIYFAHTLPAAIVVMREKHHDFE